jgi:hypothetical protein
VGSPLTHPWGFFDRTARLFVPLVLIVSILGIAGCIPATNTQTIPTSTPPAKLTTPTAAIPERPLPPTSTAPLPSATPEDAMRAWYRAWFAGDILAAKRTSTPEFAATVEAETFEGGDATDYKVLGSEGAAGALAFYISETREGVKGKTAMTVFVTSEASGKGYLVKGYEATPAGTVPAEKVPDSKTTVVETDARSAVTEALQALQEDDVPAARAVATSRFAEANPHWFTSAKGALLEFSIARTALRHDVWVVQVEEKWRGETGSVFVNFIVSDVDGAARIDRVQGWY